MNDGFIEGFEVDGFIVGLNDGTEVGDLDEGRTEGFRERIMIGDEDNTDEGTTVFKYVGYTDVCIEDR